MSFTTDPLTNLYPDLESQRYGSGKWGEESIVFMPRRGGSFYLAVHRNLADAAAHCQQRDNCPFPHAIDYIEIFRLLRTNGSKAVDVEGEGEEAANRRLQRHGRHVALGRCLALAGQLIVEAGWIQPQDPLAEQYIERAARPYLFCGGGRFDYASYYAVRDFNVPHFVGLGEIASSLALQVPARLEGRKRPPFTPDRLVGMEYAKVHSQLLGPQTHDFEQVWMNPMLVDG